MKIGIVGHEAAKFTPVTEAAARERIQSIILDANQMTTRLPNSIVSGRCHLGGIDIWAEEEGKALEMPLILFPPKHLRWHDGYRPRNLLIAQHSDIVHVIVVKELHDSYKGMRFDYCYHCETITGQLPHVKSGGCWTGVQAHRVFKKPVVWHVIDPEGLIQSFSI